MFKVLLEWEGQAFFACYGSQRYQAAVDGQIAACDHWRQHSEKTRANGVQSRNTALACASEGSWGLPSGSLHQDSVPLSRQCMKFIVIANQ